MSELIRWQDKDLTEYYNADDVDAVLAEKDKTIAELRDATRWRKFPEEKPSEEGYYIICGSSGFRYADKWTYCENRQKMDFSFYSYGVKYWIPMPKEPEAKR